jgi:hypothetical protein
MPLKGVVFSESHPAEKLFTDGLGNGASVMQDLFLTVFMKKAFAFLLTALVLLVPGCSTVEYNSTNSPRMVVLVDRTPFFHNGPAQANGPDLSLVKGDVVEVLRKEVGYSFVRIEDGGNNGYVSNEALGEAPAQNRSKPASSPTKKHRPVSTGSGAVSPGQAASPTFRY